MSASASASVSPSYPGIHIHGSRASPRGRSLLATRAFRPGELIATFASPLLAIPAAVDQRTTCNQCLFSRRPSSRAPAGEEGQDGDFRLRACTGCRSVAYCSPACQRAHWAAVHSRECKAFGRVRAGAGRDWLPTPVRALVQVLLRWREAGMQAAFGELEGNVARFRADERVWADLGLQAVGAVVYAGWEQKGEAVEMAREVLCKIQTNAFDRADLDTDQAGSFLDPTLAMVNHSCMPNAGVTFVGRTAILRAEAAISEGDEIEISYIDNNMPKVARHRGLKLYYFECKCPRCKDDLDVYQVCRASLLIPLNAFSLMPDLQRLRDPPVDHDAYQRLPKAEVERIYTACQTIKSQGVARLRERWKLCQPLVEAKAWAIEPLAQTIVETAIMYHSDRQNYGYALSLACFAARRGDPYKFVAPFRQWRLKGVMMIARLLAVTGQLTASRELEKATPHRGIVGTLERCDQVSMCQAMLLLVAHYGPMAHSEEWDVLLMARDMMSDIDRLVGREKEPRLLAAWAENPDDLDGRAFFEREVLKPVEELAGYAPEILTAELETGSSLILR